MANQIVPFEEFNRVYVEASNEILKFITRDLQEKIALHNYGWSPGLFDFRKYFNCSGMRYYIPYRQFTEGDSVCDVGGMYGVFPIALKRLGFKVTMTEALQYYSDAFNPLFDYIRSQGIEIIDFDPFEEGATLDKQFDYVTVMAVLEHYPHSLKVFMKNVQTLMKPKGGLYIEVPNVAFLGRRVHMLIGRTPYTPLVNIWKSEIPFIGHHHEFTMSELRDLAKLAGMDVSAEFFYNYWRGDYKKLSYILRRPHESLVFALFPDTRECLSIMCRKKV